MSSAVHTAPANERARTGVERTGPAGTGLAGTGLAGTGLAEDGAVAWRDELLDPAFVAGRLAHCFGEGASIERCALRRAKYRVGESLRVAYDVVVDGRDVVVSARTFADPAGAFAAAVTNAVPVAGLAGVACDPETATVWWTVPNDRKLRNMAALLDAPDRVRRVSGVSWDRSTLVEYAPERSATSRVFDHDGHLVAYAKAYVDRDAAATARQYNSVAATLGGIGLGTPRALGCAPVERIVMLEPMTGVAWTDLDAGSQLAAMQRLGTALAHVHGLRVNFRGAPFGRYRLDRVANSADIVSVARPDVGRSLRELGDRLRAGPRVASPAVWLHGDLHAGNMLFAGEAVHLIDFDQAGPGPAAADLGSMIASLLISGLTDQRVVADEMAAAVLDGYAAVRTPPSPEELCWHVAAALVVERAIRAVNRVHLPTLAVLGELIDLAAAILDRTVPLGE